MRDAFGNAFKFSPKTFAISRIHFDNNRSWIGIDLWNTKTRAHSTIIDRDTLSGGLCCRKDFEWWHRPKKRKRIPPLRDDPLVHHSTPSSTHLYLHMVLSRSLLYSNRCAPPLLYPSTRNGLYYNAAASFHIARRVTCFQEFFRSNRFHTVLSSIVNSLPKKEERVSYIFSSSKERERGNRRGLRASVCVTMWRQLLAPVWLAISPAMHFHKNGDGLFFLNKMYKKNPFTIENLNMSRSS